MRFVVQCFEDAEPERLMW